MNTYLRIEGFVEVELKNCRFVDIEGRVEELKNLLILKVELRSCWFVDIKVQVEELNDFVEV